MHYLTSNQPALDRADTKTIESSYSAFLVISFDTVFIEAKSIRTIGKNIGVGHYPLSFDEVYRKAKEAMSKMGHEQKIKLATEAFGMWNEDQDVFSMTKEQRENADISITSLRYEATT